MKTLKDPARLGSKMFGNFWIIKFIVEIITHVLPLLVPSGGDNAVRVFRA